MIHVLVMTNILKNKNSIKLRRFFQKKYLLCSMSEFKSKAKEISRNLVGAREHVCVFSIVKSCGKEVSCLHDFVLPLLPSHSMFTYHVKTISIFSANFQPRLIIVNRIGARYHSLLQRFINTHTKYYKSCKVTRATYNEAIFSHHRDRK
jgi:hypothetical protein